MLRISEVAGNHQQLDGGAMFGNAPRALWSRLMSPDELGRVSLACRCFLVETVTKKVLLETGVGSFFAPDLAQRYGVVESRHVLLDSLACLGVPHEDVDAVVLSHLHFDHAGGLLTQYQAGAPVSLLFPNAQFFVSRTALERAKNPHVRDRASFIPELPALLKASGRVVVLEDDAASASELGAQFQFFTTHGHTPGMLHTVVGGTAQKAVFCADMIPGAAWVHAPMTMGYDRFPEQLIDEKVAHYRQWEHDGTWLLFTHDPDVAATRVARNDKGRYVPLSAVSDLGCGWDLDETTPPGAHPVL